MKSWCRIFVTIVWGFLFLLSLAAADTLIATPDQGQVPLEVSFAVQSEEDFVSYAWDFENDGSIDDTSAAPDFTYTMEGTFHPTVTLLSAENQSTELSTTITVTRPATVSITATPQEGVAPLIVQFTVAAAGKEPFTYAWDFMADGTIDSTMQNPTFTFDIAGVYNSTLTVTDTLGVAVKKSMPITVTQFDSQVHLQSYFPQQLNQGENQITFIFTNEGSKVLKDISVKVIGTGIQYLTSTSLSQLRPGDQDSLVAKINLLQAGLIEARIKVLDKTFPINFTVVGAVEYNKEELQAELTRLKGVLQEQEKVYLQKKAEGYLVTEVFDSIKSSKEKLESAQKDIFTGQLASAKVDLDLVRSSLEDTNVSLAHAQQQQKSFLEWVKENIVAVAAIITGLGALSGFLVKVGLQAKKVGEHAKKASGEALQKMEEKVKSMKKKSGKTEQAVEAAKEVQEKETGETAEDADPSSEEPQP